MQAPVRRASRRRMKIAAPVVVASRNPGKLTELRMLCGDALDLRLLEDNEGVPDVEESADSYLGNALLKARAFAARSGASALADDSGLEVDALDGAPGIYSARFGGGGLRDEERCAILLAELSSRGVEVIRTARFRCVVALAAPSGEWISADGSLEGAIARAPKGEGGFGYDPVFIPTELTSGGTAPPHDRTLAEMSAAEKNLISHRAAAVRNLLAKLGR